MRSVADALKQRARELGADLVGIAPATSFPETASYHQWVASGHHGSMEYMARNADKRQDIRAWYPEARSVLMLGFCYSDNKREEAAFGQGRVARYARLRDYHPELKGRLTRLLDWLKAEQPGADGRVFVDTSPVLERLYARYAGLGWVGKSAMLVAPKLGTYFFLAGVALNLDLPADRAEPDHCGSCTACLDACPTDAFKGPRQLDASKCISFLTIENKGPIPEELRPGVGDWLFGCDVCQEVCPWNRFSRTGTAFEAPGEAALPLTELVEMDAAEFKRRFKGTPFERTKHAGMRRNAEAVRENQRRRKGS